MQEIRAVFIHYTKNLKAMGKMLSLRMKSKNSLLIDLIQEQLEIDFDQTVAN